MNVSSIDENLVKIERRNRLLKLCKPCSVLLIRLNLNVEQQSPIDTPSIDTTSNDTTSNDTIFIDTASIDTASTDILSIDSSPIDTSPVDTSPIHTPPIQEFNDPEFPTSPKEQINDQECRDSLIEKFNVQQCCASPKEKTNDLKIISKHPYTKRTFMEVGTIKNPYSNSSTLSTNKILNQPFMSKFSRHKEVGSVVNPFASFRHPTVPIDELTLIYFKAISGVLFLKNNEPEDSGEEEDALLKEFMQQSPFSENEVSDNKFLILLDSLDTGII